MILPYSLPHHTAVYFEQGDFDKCIATAERAIEEGREVRADYKIIAKSFARIGSAYLKKEDLDNAIKNFNKSLTEHRTPDVLAKLKDAEKEKAKRERLAQIDPSLADAARELGNTAFKSGDFATSVSHYAESIKLNPSDARGFTNRAAALTKLMALPEALKDAEEDIEVQPEITVSSSVMKSILSSSLLLLASTLSMGVVSADSSHHRRHHPVSSLEKRAVTLTEQYQDYKVDSKYTLRNNNWGMYAGSGSQTTTFLGLSGDEVSWSTTYTWSGGPGSVKSYSHVALTEGLGVPLSTISSIPTKWSWTYGSTTPSNAGVSYDLWTSKDKSCGYSVGCSTYEIMVWVGHDGASVPAGTKWGTVKVGGINWDLWTGTVQTWGIYSFVATEKHANFEFDLNDLMSYLVSDWKMDPSELLVGIQSGTEPFKGSATLTTTAYSVSVEVGGSSPVKTTTTSKAPVTTTTTKASVKTNTTSKAAVTTSKSTTTSKAAVTTSKATVATTSRRVSTTSRSSSAAPSTTPGSGSSSNSLYSQCGGKGFSGSTTCPSGSACVFQNDYYSQCLPSSASTTKKVATTSGNGFIVVPSATKPAVIATSSSAPPSPSAGTGSTLQPFTGALGGFAAPAITSTSDGRFAVEGSDSFMDLATAINRSCDIQHNKCANGSNLAGQSAAYTVGACDEQNIACKSA